MNRIVIGCCLAALLAACDERPAGVPAGLYQRYGEFGAPKILYRCGDTVAYSAAMTTARTYNRLVDDARGACPAKFTLLHGQQ
jgi:hypothetical protein